MSKISENIADTVDDGRLGNLCWGMLLYMLGYRGMARARMIRVTNHDFIDQPRRWDELLTEIATLTIDHETVVSSLMLAASTVSPGSDLDQCRRRNREKLSEIVRVMGDALDPVVEGIPKLGTESPRSKKERTAADGPKKGYSRYPLMTVHSDNKPPVLFAALCYAARAYAFFHQQAPERRDFDAAKTALNDLFQASQLACRLYYSLPNSHLEKDGFQDEYFQDIGAGGQLLDAPWNSSFHIWQLLQIVEIQRGHIYRHLQYLEEADRYYRRAEQRFYRLNKFLNRAEYSPRVPDSPDQDVLVFGMSPVLLLALFERSKILFDRGDLVGSMMLQLGCLGSLVASEDPIAKIIEKLAVVRRESIWDKERITKMFRYPKGADSKSLLEIVVPILANLEPPSKKWAAEIFSRLGFSLWILRRSPIAFDAKNGDDSSANEELAQYFRVSSELGTQQPAMARYCLSILDGLASSAFVPEQTAQFESLERQLAQKLREEIQKKRQGEGDHVFYEAVLTKATQNIANLVTIPRRVQGFMVRSGYKDRRSQPSARAGRLAESYLLRNGSETICDDRQTDTCAFDGADYKCVSNKFVVLRRWQSFNPKVPRPNHEQIRGGGYYLRWRGRGIAIDPGYDFIRNFYEEGFSLGDLDAVVVTHSHPDHDDDLSTLMTLVREWNEFQQLMGRTEDHKITLDLFLNESSHLKFSAWLKASKKDIGRVVPLPLVVWNNNSSNFNEAIRGMSNVRLDLLAQYGLELEVVPAWHDDVIGKTAAVGLKFHLYAGGEEVGTIGVTGDTGVYAAPPQKHARRLWIEDQYEDCDLLVAHLGDIRLRELFTELRRGPDCLLELLRDWFCEHRDGEHCAVMQRVTPDRVREFLALLVTLDLAPAELLGAELVFSGLPETRFTLSTALNHYVGQNCQDPGRQVWCTLKELQNQLAKQAEAILHNYKARIGTRIRAGVAEAAGADALESAPLHEWQVAYALLAAVCGAARAEWKYEYHLGIRGIRKLHKAMEAHASRQKESDRKDRLFIIGELPEELSSYRHHVARLLNGAAPASKVYAFTGDIGLHVGLTDPNTQSATDEFRLKLRCALCNYNTETVLKRHNYHAPERMHETALKRLESSMVYLCSDHDHHVENADNPLDFLYRPNLRLI